MAKVTPALLRRPAAAEYLAVSAGIFDQMVRDGAMPRPRLFGSIKLWSIRDLDRAIDALPTDGEDRSSTWDDVG
ncbi:MAG: hypothetical protein GX458_03420 [Phyllobacteriaceae bacterium]|nr:hypothetical protein [Phyllobacteriaceae bacterium]